MSCSVEDLRIGIRRLIATRRDQNTIAGRARQDPGNDSLPEASARAGFSAETSRLQGNCCDFPTRTFQSYACSMSTGSILTGLRDRLRTSTSPSSSNPRQPEEANPPRPNTFSCPSRSLKTKRAFTSIPSIDRSGASISISLATRRTE